MGITARAVLGLVFAALGVLYLLFKLKVSKDTRGGSIGMVPIMDGAIVFPLLLTLGIAFGLGARTPWWGYASVWLLGVPFSGWLLWLAGECDELDHERVSQFE